MVTFYKLSKPGLPPIRYKALEQGLIKVFNKAEEENLIVNMPRIGAALAGGNWSTIEQIIIKIMTVDTYVYTLENQKNMWPTTYEV